MFSSASSVGGFLTRMFSAIDGCDVALVLRDRQESDRVAVDLGPGGRAPHTEAPSEGGTARLYLYRGEEPVAGVLRVTPRGSAFTHDGVVVSLVGHVVATGEMRVEFMRVERRFEGGALGGATDFDFRFAAVKPYESFRGARGRVVYTLRATVEHAVKSVTCREELWVVRPGHVPAPRRRAPASPGLSRAASTTSFAAAGPPPPPPLSFEHPSEYGEGAVTLEVGIGDQLHIELQVTKGLYHLRDRVLGRITFLTAKMEFQGGEVQLVRREYYGAAEHDYTQTSLATTEVMDGSPIVGEVVPFRLHLDAVPRLAPSAPDVYGTLRVAYFLHLAFTADDGKRFFKQQEITLYRAEGQETVGLAAPAPLF